MYQSGRPIIVSAVIELSARQDDPESIGIYIMMGDVAG